MKKSKSEFVKDSLTVSVLTFFGLLLILLILSLVGIPLDYPWLKALLFVISIVVGSLQFFRNWKKSKETELYQKNLSFKVLRYHAEPISNTEYTLFACETTKGQCLIFQAVLHPDDLRNTIQFQLNGNRIINFKTGSSGKAPERINLNKKLVADYSDEFYCLEKSLHEI